MRGAFTPILTTTDVPSGGDQVLNTLGGGGVAVEGGGSNFRFNSAEAWSFDFNQRVSFEGIEFEFFGNPDD